MQVQSGVHAIGKPNVAQGVEKGQRLMDGFMNGRTDSGAKPLMLNRKREEEEGVPK